jgi:succinate dehydrogenase/fumarate reductase flavoprotein subunit
MKTLLPLLAYEELYWSDIAGALKRFGGSQAPLSLIGTFLNLAGNHLLYYIHNVMRKRIFYARHEATNISLNNSGDVIVTAKNLKKGINVFFRAKAVVLSNGGVPSLPAIFWKKFDVPKSIVIKGDEFLRKEKFFEIIAKLNEKP